MRKLMIAMLIIAPSIVFCQETKVEKLKVFLNGSFDQEFIISSIDYVNFVRDRKVADLHIQVLKNSLSNGSIDIEMKIYKDQEECENKIQRNLAIGSSNTEERDLILNMLTLAMLPHIQNEDILKNFSISYTPTVKIDSTPPIDKWKGWVFSSRLSGWVNGSANNSSGNTWTSLRAKRVTETNEYNFYISQNRNFQSFKVGDEVYSSLVKGMNVNANYIDRLSDHWSWGVFAYANSSSFSNIALSYKTSAALEYNIFDYEDYNDKVLRINYYLGVKHNNYIERTIYNKTEEDLLDHSLAVNLSLNKKWGSINTSISANQYLHDKDLFSINLWNSVSWNITNGLSLNYSISASLVQNQIEIAGGEMSTEEILLDNRQRASNYSYWSNVGLSYTFGSIFNNAINPRFGL